MEPNPAFLYDQFPELPQSIMPVGKDTSTEANILLMLNMITPEDLVDDDEYGEVYEDVKDECSKFGPVQNLQIHRPVKKDNTKWGENGMSAQDAQRLDEAGGVCQVCERGRRNQGVECVGWQVVW